MAKVYDGIDAGMAAWIEEQPVFFVATAPLAADGLVNLSPKGGIGTFRVVDEHTFAYLDMTGSGVETIAHLQENGRVCVMFCSFGRRADDRAAARHGPRGPRRRPGLRRGGWPGSAMPPRSGGPTCGR